MYKKQDIIKKLQEWSKEHNGKTPSQKAFFEDTDIGIWDQMKYWPNYGSLVKEAGLKPNKFDKTKYTKDQLCELFVETILEKGKWPTRGDLNVKRHSHSNFPTSSTFYRKLGLTEILAKNIVNYVKNKKGHEEVINICNPIIGTYGKQDMYPDEVTSERDGWVYLLKTTFRGRSAYKIGTTNNLERRENELNQPSNDQEIVHAIKTDDPAGIERYWHERFKDKQYKDKNEWFLLKKREVNSFKRWRRIY